MATSTQKPEATGGEKEARTIRAHRGSDLSTVVIAGVLGFAAGGLYFMNHPTLAATLRNFHAYYYNSARTTWLNSSWLGVPAEKTPQDLWSYQEIIKETAPDVLIEAGTADGGSAYYFATIFDLLGRGRVITIDIAGSAKRPNHPRIAYLAGSSTAPDLVSRVRSLIAPEERVMVSLDSDHRKTHVLEELKIYSELVTPGCYLVVEDTNVNGHPVYPEFGPGPMEALREFLNHDDRYVMDHAREKFGVTFFPDGWLRRVR
jgi:cephalosporin hydroxylase